MDGRGQAVHRVLDLLRLAQQAQVVGQRRLQLDQLAAAVERARQALHEGREILLQCRQLTGSTTAFLAMFVALRFHRLDHGSSRFSRSTSLVANRSSSRTSASSQICAWACCRFSIWSAEA